MDKRFKKKRGGATQKKSQCEWLKSLCCSGRQQGCFGDARSVTPEDLQVRWVSVWITGVVKWSIQSPAEYVLVIYASSAEALLHPFPPSQLISAVIHAAQAVLTPGL